jgi:PAS domain S-box-containing protein
MSWQRYFKSRGWLFVGIWLLTSSGIVLAGVFYYLMQQREFTVRVKEHMLQGANFKVEQIQDWHYGLERNANLIRTDGFLSQALSTYLSHPDNTNLAGQIRSRMASIMSLSDCLQVQLVDASPKVVLRVSSSPHLATSFVTESASRALLTDKIIFSDLHRNRNTGQCHLDLAIPILSGDPSEAPRAVLQLEVDTSRFLYPLLDHWPTPSTTAETYLVRREEDRALYLTRLRHQEEAELLLSRPLTDTNSLAVKAALGQTGYLEGLDYRGEPAVAALQPIPKTSWLLIAKVDRQEIQGLVQVRTRLLWAIVSAGILAASLAFWSLWRAHQRRLLEHELAKRKLHEVQLTFENDFLNTLLANMPDAIYFKDRESRYVRVGQAFQDMFKVDDIRAVIGKTDFDFFTREHASQTFKDEQEIMRTGLPMLGRLEKETYLNGRLSWGLSSKLPWRNKQGEIIGTFGITKDVTRIKETEAELAEANRKLMLTCRQAGMAEVATGILHNMGHALNTINIACVCISDRLRQSPAEKLFQLSKLAPAQAEDWPEFVANDPRGRHVPQFLLALADTLQAENAALLNEMSQLQKSVDHIKEIVAAHQSYARVADVVEPTKPEDLMRDALELHASALSRDDIRITRRFDPVPAIRVNKHKALGILVNLIQNARQACEETQREDKELILQVTQVENRVRFSVSDNGTGIVPENMARIFSHGFTTRKNGHGFGLHSGAFDAQQMGGSLTMHSAGANQGATFVLELPLVPPSQVA